MDKIKVLIVSIATTTLSLNPIFISEVNASVKMQDASRNYNGQLIVAKMDSKSLKSEIVTDFADYVIIPTYEELVKKAENLSQSINIFVSNPSQNTLKAAQKAWMEARFPWEQSEAFAFGPAESLGYDGDLDDWPVNEIDVSGVLKSNNKLTIKDIANLQTTQKGFHTIELLLFGLDNDKKVQNFSARELVYMQLLGAAFENTSRELLKSWSKGVEGNPAYREVLATAGNSNNSAYLTVEAAFEELIMGMIGCLDEVGNEKIGAPLEEKTTDNLESRFSHSSLDDFKNNILSVENAYLGRVPQVGTQGKSISLWVAMHDRDLDRKVKNQIRMAIASIEEIPNPIERNITNQTALRKMETAQTNVLNLFETMEEEVLPLVKGS